MKHVISLITLILVVCCKSHHISGINEPFFETCALKTNRFFSTDSISYEEYYYDHHFPELGTFKTPKTHLNVKFDTDSGYVVILVGNINFKKNKYKYETKDMESVSLKRMSIWKLSDQRKQWVYTKDSVISLDNCPIPKDYLSILKKDFFFVYEYLIINVRKNESNNNSFPIVRTYKLY